MAHLGVPVGGRVRKLRAVEDQSAPIPEEITNELGEMGNLVVLLLAERAPSEGWEGNSQTILLAR